jgi:hypothetical protein
MILSCCVSKKQHETVLSDLEKNKMELDLIKSQFEESKTTISQLEKNLSNEMLLSTIKDDYIELFKQHSGFMAMSTDLDHRIKIYSKDILQSDLEQLEKSYELLQEIVSRIRLKLNENPNIKLSGIPDELNSIEELNSYLNSVDNIVAGHDDTIAQIE